MAFIAFIIFVIAVLLLMQHPKMRRSYRSRLAKSEIVDAPRFRAEDPSSNDEVHIETQSSIPLPPKGGFDFKGCLNYRDAFYREDVPFLSDHEFQEYSNSGIDAVEKFCASSKIAWKKFEKEKEELRLESRQYESAYTKHLVELLDILTSRLSVVSGCEIPYRFWQRDHVWKFGSFERSEWGGKNWWLVQCFLLSKLKRLPLQFTDQQVLEESVSVFGIKLDELYPAVASRNHLGLVRSLVYDFGYGPNAFAWHDTRVDKDHLSSRPAKLYLVSIDAGTLTGQKKCLVWKIGITTRPNIVGKSASSRYSGKYASHVHVLREIEYQDGSIAYMKEQTFLKLASLEKSRSVGTRVDWAKLSDRDRSTLGLSEIVLVGRAKSLALALFDQITF